MEVEVIERPLDRLDEWCVLFASTVRRHSIEGIRAFSRTSFEQQLALPGMVMFRAVHQGATAGLHLWSQRGVVAYGHLAGTTETGYQHAVAYALYSEAAEWYATAC